MMKIMMVTMMPLNVHGEEPGLKPKKKIKVLPMMTWLLVVVMKMSIYVGSIYSGTYHNFMRLIAT